MIALLALSFSLALADTSSGPETCVIESYDSAHCEVCTGAYYGDSTYCSTRLDADRDFACQTQGASVWDEIWCDPGFTEPVKVEADPDDTGCAAAGGAAALVGVFGLLVGRRKR